MEHIYQEGGISIQWWDDEQNVVYIEVEGQPSWEAFYAATSVMNEQIRLLQKDVYKIYYFLSPILYTSNWVPNLQRLIQGNPPNTKLVIFVQAGESLEDMLMITGKVFRLRNISKTFRFSSTIEEAFQIIEQHTLQSYTA